MLRYPDDNNSYRSRRKNKAEGEATERERMRMEIVAEFEARMKEKMDMLVEKLEQWVEERVQAMRQQDAVTTLESPSALYRSSYSSAPDNALDNMLDQHTFPIGGFKGDPPPSGRQYSKRGP